MFLSKIPLSMSQGRAFNPKKIGEVSHYVTLIMFLVSASVFFIAFFTELNMLPEVAHDLFMIAAFAIQLAFPMLFISILATRAKINLNEEGRPYFFLFFLVYIFFLFSLVSFLWSDYPTFVIKKSLTIFLPTILLSIVMLFDENPIKTFNRVSLIFVIISVLSSLYGVAILILGEINQNPLAPNIYEQYISLGALKIPQILYGMPPFPRISSFLGNPNRLAILNSVGIILTLYLARINYIKKYTGVFLIFVQSISLLLTYSRDGIIFASFMIFAYSLWFAKRGVKRIAGLLFGGVLLVLFLLVIYLAYQSLTFVPVHADGQSFLEKRLSLGLNGRDRIWKPVIEQISATPLFGTGFGTATEAILRPRGIEHTVHSSHLQILAELGIVGYALFLITFFIFGGFALRAIRKAPSFAVQNVGAITFALAFGFFVHDFLESVIVLWGPFTLLTGYAMFTLLHPRVMEEVVQESETRGIPVLESSVYT